jgi:hypothetical protein
MATNKSRGIANPKIDIPTDPNAWVSSGAENGDRQLQAVQQEEVKKKSLKRITLTVSEDLHKRTHIYARQHDITVTELITNFLEGLTSGN